MSTICLNMIVKNESHIIIETLQNICDSIHFDYWVISDTGSSDNTVDLIVDFFKEKNIKGKVVHHSWKNFSYNRNLALDACLGKSDYVFFFDADDLIKGKPDIPKNLTADVYYLKITSDNSSTTYYRKLLVRNNGIFYWRGVVHEYLENKERFSEDYIGGDYTVISRRLGSRNKVAIKEKYLQDAQLLTSAFNNREDPELAPRYAFYAAQSYNDAGEFDLAIEWYLKRTMIQEGWVDECYISYLKLGFIAEGKGDFKQAIDYWQLGINLCPERAEAWYHIARRYNWDKNFQLAYTFASQGVNKEYPKTNRLFINKDIYNYWLHYECCINAYQCGNYLHSYEEFKKLLYSDSGDLIKRVCWQIEKYNEFIGNEKFLSIKEIRKLLSDKKLNDISEKYFSFSD